MRDDPDLSAPAVVVDAVARRISDGCFAASG
jgi:hypothetical protein